ncbi:MAG: Ig-like domain-containing protein, partial [Oscillospiraceae bacterium]|nr:Ig-like domain-containing protein [Oscillospiraceae bacterium]
MAKFCNNCGKQLDATTKFCASCGAQQPQAPPQPQPQPQPPQYQQAYAPAPKPKSKTPLIVGGIGGALAVILLVVLIATNVFGLFGSGGGQLWDGGDLELYPAYLSVPNGHSIYLDWNTAKSNQGIEWRSSDETVATVDTNGLVTTVGGGEAVITAALIGKPEVTAKCGIYVAESSVHDNAPGEIIIWENGPPSIYYRMGVIGLESMSLDVELVVGYEPGENIPICLSMDNEDLLGDETLANGVASKARGASMKFLSTSRSSPKRPLRISKKKIRPKIIENNTWTILVKGDHLYYSGSHKDTSVLKGGPNGIKNNIYATFELSVSKRGGSSPVGSYGGTLEYTLDYDFSPHFAEHPDHSLCDYCWRGYKDLYTGEEYTGHYPGQPSGDTIIT